MTTTIELGKAKPIKPSGPSPIELENAQLRKELAAANKTISILRSTPEFTRSELSQDQQIAELEKQLRQANRTIVLLREGAAVRKPRFSPAEKPTIDGLFRIRDTACAAIGISPLLLVNKTHTSRATSARIVVTWAMRQCGVSWRQVRIAMGDKSHGTLLVYQREFGMMMAVHEESAQLAREATRVLDGGEPDPKVWALLPQFMALAEEVKAQ